MSKTRILFVDDEPNVLEGLRRMLRKFRDEWDMLFVASGVEAISTLGSEKVDVLVTDLKMPGMDGVELLERVVEQYPDTVRLVLTGHADESMTKRAMKAAHQFLNKPTDADTLKAAISKACASKDMVANDQIRRVVASCDTLPTLPSLYTEITRAVESETANAKTIAAIICKDVAMSAKLLQLVNSSFFGIGRRVSSVEQTITLLGITRIKGLVLQESLLKQFAVPKELPHFPVKQFWDHCLLVAEMARLISITEKQEGDRPDQAFTAGLLHDIGKLILAARETKQYETVLETAVQAGEAVHAVEQRVLGVTHSEVGAYLLRLWGLPDRIVEAIEYHHSPSAVNFDGVCALTMVHVADALVAQFMPTTLQAGLAAPAIDKSYLQRVGCEEKVERWTEVTEQACAQRFAACERA